MLDKKNEYIIKLQNELIEELNKNIDELLLENKYYKASNESLTKDMDMIMMEKEKFERLYFDHRAEMDSGC